MHLVRSLRYVDKVLSCVKLLSLKRAGPQIFRCRPSDHTAWLAINNLCKDDRPVATFTDTVVV